MPTKIIKNNKQQTKWYVENLTLSSRHQSRRFLRKKPLLVRAQ